MGMRFKIEWDKGKQKFKSDSIKAICIKIEKIFSEYGDNLNAKGQEIMFTDKYYTKDGHELVIQDRIDYSYFLNTIKRRCNL